MELFSLYKTKNEVKKRYRELAMILHPDYGGASWAFHELNCEYQRALCESRKFQDESENFEEDEEEDGYCGLNLCDRSAAKLWARVCFDRWDRPYGLDLYKWYRNWKVSNDINAAIRRQKEQQQRTSPAQEDQKILVAAGLLLTESQWQEYQGEY